MLRNSVEGEAQSKSGTQRKLVIAFDVGTTFSGAAYAVLDPGEVPKIQAVTRYPAQENGDFKIPSILYYGQDGSVRAAGAEAAAPAMRLEAEDDNLIRSEWFKLHLSPASLGKGVKNTVPPLPAGKTVVDVFGDFLGYLFGCTRRFIHETHANGGSIWDSVGDRIEFVLSHPNGWEGSQQGQMRNSAVVGGLVPDTAVGRGRVHFVSEGEASLHYCLASGLASETIKDGMSAVIIDAGGGTVDVSTYAFKSAKPILVEETTAPDCILQGSTRVNVRAREFLETKLKKSKYGNDEDIITMLERFEKSTQPTFKDPSERSFIQFGSMRDQDLSVGIRRGQLLIEGSDVAAFFQPSVQAIAEIVEKQLTSTSDTISVAFLVGGFAASPWLFRQLQDLLRLRGLTLCRPDNHTNKAVAEGAISFFLEHYVSVRVTKAMYGAEIVVNYDDTDAAHRIRRGRLINQPSGRQVLPEAYAILLPKGHRARENEESEMKLFREASQPTSLNRVSADVISYRGKAASPRWIDTEPEYFTTLCTVYADTSQVAKTQHHGPKGLYYTQDYKIILLCGLTEMKALISWVEKGQEKRGPAQVIYDNNAEAA